MTVGNYMYTIILGYVNYTDIAWASTSKSKLECLCSCQKHTARVNYPIDRYTHTIPLLNDIKWYVFKLDIFNILCFMYKCKQNLNPPVFRNIFTHRINFVQEPLCQTDFSQYCISHCEPNLWNKTVISKKINFQW